MTLYAAVTDLRLVLDSTDAGTGTAAQLSDQQLTLSLQAASDRVEVYVGNSWAQASDAPQVVGDLTLDLAAWWATTYYSKQKEMGPNHPVVLRYTEAKAVLEDIRKGVIDINVPVTAAGGAGGPGDAADAVIHNPWDGQVFTLADSNTRRADDGSLAADTPPDMARMPRFFDDVGGW